jgi:hypothetical protein
MVTRQTTYPVVDDQGASHLVTLAVSAMGCSAHHAAFHLDFQRSQASQCGQISARRDRASTP